MIEVLQREAKKRKEAADVYEGGGRPELAAKERSEAIIIEEFLPVQLSEEEIMAISKEMGIPVQFGTDIERWGMIALAGYREQARFYKSFGEFVVKIVDPLNLIAPKLSRFLDRDIEDVKVLIKNFKISRYQLLEHLKQVYDRSPVSIEKGLFRNQVAQFMKDYQKELWNRQEPLPLWLTVLK